MAKTDAKRKKAPNVRYRDNYQAKLRRREVIKYLCAELANSTTHGLPYIVNNKIHWCERVFWTLSFLSAACTVFLLSSLLLRFYETPIVMSVEMDYFNWNVSYPAFTLCPTLKSDEDKSSSFVKDRFIHTVSSLCLLWSPTRILNFLFSFSETFNGTNQKLLYMWAIVNANFDTLDTVCDMIDKHLTEDSNLTKLIHPSEYASIAALTFHVIERSAVTSNTNRPLDVDSAMTELGMCHVINSNVAYLDNPNVWGSEPRPYVKSNIVLSVHDRDFYTQVTNYYADDFKIFIHSPEETILSSSPYSRNNDKGFRQFGVEVWSTKISEDLKYQSVRFRKCRFINENISDRYPVYSYNHCMLECRIKMIIRLCGCIPHFYKPLPHETVCHVQELMCVLQYKKEILTLSASARTLKRFGNSKDIPGSPRECGCLSSCETDVYKKDFETFLKQSYYTRLRIGIYNFPKVRVVRDVIFKVEDIILKVAGAINLCVGASIISMVEFVMTFLRWPIRRLANAVSTLGLKISNKWKIF